MATKRNQKRSHKRTLKRKNRRPRRVQRGGNLAGLLDNADGVPIVHQQNVDFHAKFQPHLKASDLGDTLTIEQAQSEPHTYWKHPPPSIFYTLVCWDPDAAEKSWLHWLVINCDGPDPTTGDIIVDWSPPSPPKGSGLHRYIFGLFQQVGKLTIPPMKSSGGFNPATFATEHKLAPLVYKGIRVNI